MSERVHARENNDIMKKTFAYHGVDNAVGQVGWGLLA
jgi:hypothetical protein